MPDATDRAGPRRPRARGRAVALILWLVVVTAAAPSPGATPGEPSPGATPATPPSDQPATLGRTLFQRHCAGCHGQRGEGGGQAPGLVGVGTASTDFMLTTGRMPYQDERAFMTRHPPAYRPHEIRALVEYVESLGAGGPAIPILGPGDVKRGRRLFQERCGACHSTTGWGGALSGGRIAPPLDQATPTQVGEAIRIGPFVMPRFPEPVLSAADVDDLAAYVEVLRDRRGDLDRGGVPFDRIGPFAEGAVAWGIGMSLLVLFTQLLGSRRP